jgi:hypothetical protein
MQDLIATGSGAADVLNHGGALVQTQTEFQTALMVQKERDIDKVVAALDKEAEYAGGSFYYSWKVKDKSGRMVTVEGLSIGGEMAIAREFGNCAIIPKFEETSDAYIFSPTFIDLERGFTISRVFKQSKGQAPGKYGAERWADMQLQIGQSKAIRNVVKAAMPAWLQDRILKRSKQAVINGINAEGIAEAADKAVRFLKGNGIPDENIVATMGKPINDFTSEDVATLRGMCQQINDGVERAESLFGIEEEKASTVAADIDKSTGEVKDKKDPAKPAGKKKTTAKKSKPEVQDPPKPDAEDEQKADADAGEPQEVTDAKKTEAEKKKKEAADKKKAAAEKKKKDAAAKKKNEDEKKSSKLSGADKHKAAFEKLTKVLDCNRYLHNNKDEIQKDIPLDEQPAFFEFAEAHILHVKEVLRRDLEEAAS